MNKAYKEAITLAADSQRELDRTQSRLAAALALAKEELKIVCDEYCGYGFMPRQHDEKCLSFQQRIKELENQ